MPPLTHGLLAVALTLAPVPDDPGSAAPAAADPAQPEEPAPVQQATDEELPQATGHALQLRVLRQMEAQIDDDLTGFWDDYEEDVRDDGETRTFPNYVAQKFRVRRGLGIGLTALGTVMLGSSGIAAWGASDAFNDGIPVLPGFFIALAICAAAGGITGIALGARIWHRNQARLNDLRAGGYIAGGPRWRLRAAGPGLHLSF